MSTLNYPAPADPAVLRVIELYGFDELQARRHIMQRRELAEKFAKQGNTAPWGNIYAASEEKEKQP